MIGAVTSDRCLIGAQQHQHRGDEGDEAADRLRRPAAVCHSATTITADSAQAASICVNGVMAADAATRLQRQAAQRVAQALEALGLRWAGAVQAHDAPGQHVLLDHVGQLVGGVLALAR